MQPDDRVYVAGHRGLVGSAVVRRLRSLGYEHVITATRSEADLSVRADVEQLFADTSPTHVVLAAAKVGGIVANDSYPGEFIRENLAIQWNVIEAARRHGVARLLFLGSSCVYPREAPQPMPEDCLLTGPLEATNRAYAIAKIAGLEMCRAYRSQYGCLFTTAMPTNLYGPNDNFDLESSHVLPALIRRFHEAREGGHPTVTLWGSGHPRREFLHVDDLAEALLVLMRHDAPADLVNIGVGEDLRIRELAALVARVVGYRGRVEWDETRPDGVPRKLLDVRRIEALGWSPRITLEEGVERTYRWYLSRFGGSD